MRGIEAILQSKSKPKEKVTLLSEEIKKDKAFVREIIAYFPSASSGDQGHLIESLEYASQDHPELIAPHLDFVLKHLEDKASRVKWECARIIVNLSKKFSDQTQRAVPILLKNTHDKGTVVRWSTAFALGEIAKHHPSAAETLLPQMKALVEEEVNNGVKNVYLKALKAIERKEK